MKDRGRFEELKHQGTDFTLSPVVSAVIVFVVIGALIHVGVWWLYRHVREQDRTRDVRRSFVETKPPVPPEPRLEVNPQEDFQMYFRQQQEALGTYGWISRDEGKVRIPIGRAMDLFVERHKQ